MPAPSLIVIESARLAQLPVERLYSTRTVGRSTGNKRFATRMRHAIIFVLVRKGGYSRSRAAAALGMDHSSAIYALGQLPERMQRQEPEALRAYKIVIRLWVKLCRAEIEQQREALRKLKELQDARDREVQRSQQDARLPDVEWRAGALRAIRPSTLERERKLAGHGPAARDSRGQSRAA